LLKVKGEKKFRLSGAFKGTKTLFDEPCFACDVDNAQSAKAEWARRALDQPQVTDEVVLKDIKSRVRYYMGTKWWREERCDDGGYVPDQQGCAELPRGFGGTLSVRRRGEPIKPHWRDLIPNGELGKEPPVEGPVAKCRVGTAKTKGKLRVVTMQGARAKRLLRPVHQAAYNHICKKPWVVCGDVTAEHMSRISDDRKEGEAYNSGDFEASTDNLNKDAVFAVVEVLAEALPERRKKVLLKTFDRTWVEWGGKKRYVVRGSMMGNLLSFVVLCLLNKVCLDRARQEVESCGPEYRAALVNGDDLLFAGGVETYEAWLRATASIGFVVNRSKTMVSHRYGDLNSTTYDFGRRRFVPKLNFGFLGTEMWKEPEGTVADSLFLLVKQVRFSTAAWLLNTRPVQSIFCRCPPALTLFPRRWWQFLVKKRWFRSCMSLPEVDVRASGCDRKLPFVLGPPLCESSPAFEKEIARFERTVSRSYVREWRGVLCVPSTKRVEARSLPTRKSGPSNIRLSRGAPFWQRLWFKPLLTYLEDFFPEKLSYDRRVWVDDQPGLKVHIPLVRSRIRPLCFSPSFLLLPDAVPVVRDDGVVYLVQG
jgi:hypothetical protein